jgi:hypothetical protein
MVLGLPNEVPHLGAGGAITPLADPSATAHELAKLLTDSDWYANASCAIQNRVRTYYNKTTVDRIYSGLYKRYRMAPDKPHAAHEENPAWPV